MNNFCTNLGFSRSARYILFFKDGRFFYATFFSFVFIEAPSIFLETKRFASIKDSSGFSGQCDLLETLTEKNPHFFSFLKGFRLRKMGFRCFRLRKMVFQSYVYPFGFLCGAVKLMKILTILSFYHWLSVWYRLSDFLIKSYELSSQVFANHGSVSVGRTVVCILVRKCRQNV